MEQNAKTRNLPKKHSPKAKRPKMDETGKVEITALDAPQGEGRAVEAANAADAPEGLKIAVYAIAKDEAKFAARWMKSMKEADGIFVMDTGSKDSTMEILEGMGATVVRREIVPWRFDVARNESMALVPDGYDVLVCTDLDEILCPGWRKRLEAAWLDALRAGISPTTATYEYVWNFNADGSDGVKFTYKKVHAPHVAKWTHPVHEVLSYDRKTVEIAVPGMRLEHHADDTKSRAQYLPLLKMSVEECPEDDRNAHYYGRELMFHRMWDEAIAQLKRHLAMPTATWKAERAASMRYIARCMMDGRRDYAGAVMWLKRAIAEDPAQREAAVELAEMADRKRDWSLEAWACEQALKVTKRDLSYTTRPEAWGSRPEDLYSVALWYLGRRDEAREHVKRAMAIDPGNQRIRNNARLMGLKV